LDFAGILLGFAIEHGFSRSSFQSALFCPVARGNTSRGYFGRLFSQYPLSLKNARGKKSWKVHSFSIETNNQPAL
jgi:hypothetical protein